MAHVTYQVTCIIYSLHIAFLFSSPDWVLMFSLLLCRVVAT